MFSYLFWGDGGSVPKIERSTLIGENRRTLITQGILHPFAITVDASRSRIFWVDAYRDTVESADLYGLQRKVITRYSHTQFYDITIYKVWLSTNR